MSTLVEDATPTERRVTGSKDDRKLHIAVLVPCYNEATTIGTVIDDFRAVVRSALNHLPYRRITESDSRLFGE